MRISRIPFDNASGVPGIALFQASNAANDARDGVGMPETVQPAERLPPLAHLDHDRIM
jgi:hypothetical protein